MVSPAENCMDTLLAKIIHMAGRGSHVLVKAAGGQHSRYSKFTIIGIAVLGFHRMDVTDGPVITYDCLLSGRHRPCTGTGQYRHHAGIGGGVRHRACRKPGEIAGKIDTCRTDKTGTALKETGSQQTDRNTQATRPGDCHRSNVVGHLVWRALRTSAGNVVNHPMSRPHRHSRL